MCNIGPIFNDFTLKTMRVRGKITRVRIKRGVSIRDAMRIARDVYRHNPGAVVEWTAVPDMKVEMEPYASASETLGSVQGYYASGALYKSLAY